MLADHTPTPAIATADLEKARAFYEGTLGFTPVHEEKEAGAVVYKGGSGTFLLYTSQYAGTNKATAMGFNLPREAFDAEVSRLRAAGLTFDTFDLPGTTWTDGVAALGDGRAVWFRDPDGNTIAVDTGWID